MESGTGSDVVNLSLPGYGNFNSSPSVSTLTVNGVPAFTIGTYIVSNTVVVPLASQINVMGKGDLAKLADIYDGPGNNSLVASGNTVTLKRNLRTVTAEQTLALTDFGLVAGFETLGSNDTVHQEAIDFSFRTFGRWISD